MNSAFKLCTVSLALVAGLAFAQNQAAEKRPPPPDYPGTGHPNNNNGARPAVKKGLTWGLYPADAVTGTATVSCSGAPGGPCNPYQGDTPGNAKLPVLCFKPAGLPYPVPSTGASSNAGYWSGGIIATTPPVSPIAMGWVGTGKAPVDAYCAAQFGTGWEVAEHHMGQGQGWKFGAYGNVGKPGQQRFWVHINNQPNGNVW